MPNFDWSLSLCLGDFGAGGLKGGGGENHTQFVRIYSKSRARGRGEEKGGEMEMERETTLHS